MENAGETLPYGWSKRLSVPSDARFRTLRLEGVGTGRKGKNYRVKFKRSYSFVSAYYAFRTTRLNDVPLSPGPDLGSTVA